MPAIQVFPAQSGVSKRWAGGPGARKITTGPAYNPWRNHIYLAPGAAGPTATTRAQRSTSSVIKRVSTASFSWVKLRLIMMDISGTPVAPEGIWFGLGSLGMTEAVYGSGWVAATGLQAPPSGTENSPGIGFVCDAVTLPSDTATNSVVVRIQMPSGQYATMNLSTNPANLPDWIANLSKAIDGPIAGDPGTITGWGEAFGVLPWFILEVSETSVPQCVIGGIGDSHVEGYLVDDGGKGSRGMLGEMYALQGAKNLNIVNLGRTGHTTTQIASRLRAFEEALDIGGWIRERASINDMVGFDVTTAQADASFAQLQDDYAYLAGRGKFMIPMESAGATDWADGWYDRYTYREPDEITAFPARMYNASSICNADGSYQANMGASDKAHPSGLGYSTWASPSWASFQAAMTTLGLAV